MQRPIFNYTVDTIKVFKVRNYIVKLIFIMKKKNHDIFVNN